MPNATERKALIVCAFFAGLLCAIPMVGKVAVEGSSAGAILKSLLFLLRSLAHPVVVGVWTLGALLMGMHVLVSRREAKQQQALPAGGTEQPAASDASSALPETPSAGA